VQPVEPELRRDRDGDRDDEHSRDENAREVLPLAARREPDDADSGRHLRQERDRPESRPAEAEDEHDCEQRPDVADHRLRQAEEQERRRELPAERPQKPRVQSEACDRPRGDEERPR